MPVVLDPDTVEDPQHFSPFGIPVAMMDLLFGELDEDLFPDEISAESHET